MAKLETVVSDELVDWVVETIQRAAFTGKARQRKVFVIQVECAVHIRSRNQGLEVL